MCDNNCDFTTSKKALLEKGENNCLLNKSFKLMKNSIIYYINQLSKEFGDAYKTTPTNERNKMNVIIEGLIAGLHDSILMDCHKLSDIPFLLIVQKKDSSDNNVYDLGEIDNNTKINSSYGSIRYLYPNKLSHSINSSVVCNQITQETLFYYINSFTLLYDPKKSSLKIRIGYCNYTLPTKTYMYPLNLERSNCYFKTYELIPDSEDSIWDDEFLICDYISDITKNNNDLTYMIADLDNSVLKCESTDNLIRTKLALLKLTGKEYI